MVGALQTKERHGLLCLREVKEHATASKRQCLDTLQHGHKHWVRRADVIFIMVKNLCDQLEAFGMKNYDAGNLSQIIKGNN